MNATEKHKCEKEVWDRYGYRFRCGKTAKYKYNEKWYCSLCHPEMKAARKAKRDEKQKIKWDAWSKKQNVLKAERDKNTRFLAALNHFCEGLTVEFMEQNRATDRLGARGIYYDDGAFSSEGEANP